MKDVQIQQHNELVDEFDGALLADGFEEALVGFGYRFSHPVAIYDYNRCIEVLMNRDGMTDEEAIEFFDFNVSGAYVGESTPVFIMHNV
jgi:hypothetical protein